MKTRWLLGIAAGLAALAGCGCAGGAGEKTDTEADPGADPATEAVVSAPLAPAPDIHPLTLNSPAFPEGSSIPKRHTCDGEDLSPELAWTELPVEAQSLALVCSDPDAPSGTWDHWVLWNIAPETRVLPQGVPADTELGRPGINGWKTEGYRGPCPPHGTPHRYVFQLYGLDTQLELEGEVTREALEAAMEGHVVFQGSLMGTYQRGSGK